MMFTRPFQPIELKTPRLLIREMRLEDAEIIWNYAQDPLHRRYEPDAPRTLAEFNDIVVWIVTEQSQNPRQFHYVSVCLHTDPHTPIGSVHISVRDVPNRQAEVGYTFGVPFWGKGYGTEAASAMVNYAFREMNMHRVFAADIIAENIGSSRIAEKMGMRLEGTLRESTFFNDRWWDTKIYGILQHEWRYPLV